MISRSTKPQMEEGPKAKEKFERAMKAIFRVPKADVAKAEKEYKASRKKNGRVRKP